MKLALLHLSDIHLRESENPIIDRAEKIVSALYSADPFITGCVVALTGDVAFSGKRQEYDHARTFVAQLKQHVYSRYGESQCWFVSVPGNHDCDFSKPGELRELALKRAAENVEIIKVDNEIMQHLLSVQAEFFSFESELNGSQAKPWIVAEQQKTIGTARIKVNCFNTAFASRLSERQGDLFLPIHELQKTDDTRGEVISVSLFHHPYQWLEANNGLKFRRHIEDISDIVLTGHMHSQATYTKSNLEGSTVSYHEGAVLQSNDTIESGFNVITCDVSTQQIQRFEFAWEGDLYIPKRQDTGRLVRGSNSGKGVDLTADYEAFLDDSGVGFSHPRKARVSLSDVFVYPDLSKFSLEHQSVGRTTPEAVFTEDVSNFIYEQKRLLVLGADQSGRTALARTIYRDFQRRGFVPLMLCGPDLKGANEKRFVESIRDAIKKQYSHDAINLYEQLGPERKILIVDDWHRANLNTAGKALIAALATKLYERIVIFTGELFRIEEISGLGEAFSALRSFQLTEIREFGHYLRGLLIKKWLCLGREMTWDHGEREREVHKTEQTISQILGKNLLPSSPVIILSVLQALEASKGVSAPSGSYGYLYEALITSALATVSKDTSDLDLKYTFISRLAFYQFSKELSSLNRQQIEEINRAYFDEYSISIPIDPMLVSLEKAQVLSYSGCEYSFRYKYIYYYFVARFFSEALRSHRDKEPFLQRLGEMANQVYYQEYSSILLFVLYLTKNQELIQHILSNADRVFGDIHPCEFQDDVSFVNRLYKEPARVLVPSTDVERNREEYRKQLDKADSDEGLIQLRDAKVEYSDSLEVIVKINIAVKTLQLLGQVLRNFPGSLRKESKAEITKSCYLLGLRLVNAVLALAEKNLELFRCYVAELIRNHRPTLSDQELAKTTDEAIIWLTRRAAFGVIKTISYSVGLEMLKETYREVLENSGSLISFRLIDLCVKLDHFTVCPETEITELWGDLRKNMFSSTLLRDLVAHYLYLFPVDYRRAQRIGNTLDIQISAPQMRNPRTKKLKPKGE